MDAKESLARLEAYRARLNLSKKALAKLVGIPTGTLNAWMAPPDASSKRPPSSERLKKIENFLSNVKDDTLRVEKLLNDEPPIPERQKRFEKVVIKTETAERVSRLRQLFLLAAQDLEALRQAKSGDRDIYRATLDVRDIGYLSSLMSMMCDEKQFSRWQQFTTYRFRQFKNSEES